MTEERILYVGNIGDTEENDDWMKRLPGYADEIPIHEELERRHREGKGGPGSGHHGHRGRPGQRGGSAPGRGKTVYRKVSASDFIKQRDASVPEKYQPFVHPYTAQEYKGWETTLHKDMGGRSYLSNTRRSGFTISRDGDIISVFSAPGAKEGRAAIEEAKRQGGTHLDCFGGNPKKVGKLVEFYTELGFKEYDRWPWDDQYAPEGWDYEKFGRPDVVLMSLSGEPPG